MTVDSNVGNHCVEKPCDFVINETIEKWEISVGSNMSLVQEDKHM